MYGKKLDKFVREHSIKEIATEQEQAADFLEKCIMLHDNVFSLLSSFTRDDIDLIIQQIRLI